MRCWWKWILLAVFLAGSVVGCRSEVKPQSTASPLRSTLTLPLDSPLDVPTLPPELPQPTETVIERAVADLVNHQGCSRDEISVVAQEPILWWGDELTCDHLEAEGERWVMIVTQDGDRYEEYSQGSQDKGEMYLGYRVLLRWGNEEYVYYVSERTVIQCQSD